MGIEPAARLISRCVRSWPGNEALRTASSLGTTNMFGQKMGRNDEAREAYHGMSEVVGI
jgi:hypothetical protein